METLSKRLTVSREMHRFMAAVAVVSAASVTLTVSVTTAGSLKRKSSDRASAVSRGIIFLTSTVSQPPYFVRFEMSAKHRYIETWTAEGWL